MGLLGGEANDEYLVKVAETIEEATNLIAVGYEYVSTMDKKANLQKKKMIDEKIGVFIES